MNSIADIDLREDFQRNHIINGGFDFWQRATNFPNPSFASIVDSLGGRYTADRWHSFTFTAAQNFTISRESVNLVVGEGPSFAAKIQRNPGEVEIGSGVAGDSHALNYTFESRDVRPLRGQLMTLSYFVNRGADYSGTNGSLLTIVSSGQGEDEGPILPLTGQVDVVNEEVLLSSTFEKVTHTFIVPSDCNQLRIRFQFDPNGTAGAEDFFQIANVMLNLGGSAGSFRRAGLNMAGELLLCQRYYHKTWDTELNPTTGGRVVGLARNDGLAIIQLKFPTTMRIRPTIGILTAFSGTGAAVNLLGDSAVEFSINTNPFDGATAVYDADAEL